MSGKRLLSPKNIIYLWHAIYNNGPKNADFSKVVEFLVNCAEYQKSDIDKLIKNAIHDGVIIPIYTDPNHKKNIKSLRIPRLNEVNTNEESHDWYCFECHEPDNLEHCMRCLRSFHEDCWRNNPDISNKSEIIIPSNQKFKKKLQISDENENLNNNNLLQTTVSFDTSNSVIINNESVTENEAVSEISFLNEDDVNITSEEEIEENGNEEEKPSIYQGSLDSMCYDETFFDRKPVENEIIYVGEVRPPSKRGFQNTSLKEENINCDNNEELAGKHLCTVCRLMEKSKFRDPPNVTNHEICYILKFVFERIKSWIAGDTFSPKPYSESWTLPLKKYLEVFSKLCFKFHKTLSEMNNKLKNNLYSTLTEFQCDFLDIQHCIGILYGTCQSEYLQTDYLMSDCVYDLTEIRSCRDCYRHSNEKLHPYWFCKPCLPRHELVFAKHGVFSFWPAKVIKVINNKYDVRFFGGNHSRAIVDKVNIKSIDADIEELKIKKSAQLLKALNELQKHQELLKLAPGLFSFEKEKILQNTISFSIPVNQLMSIRQSLSERKASSRLSKRIASESVMQLRNSTRTRESQENNSTITGNKRRKINTNTSQNFVLSNNESIERRKNKSSSKNNNTRTRSSLSSSSSPNLTHQDQSGGSSLEDEDTLFDEKVVYSNIVKNIDKKLATIKNLNPATKMKILGVFKLEIVKMQNKINEIHEKNIIETKKHTWCFKCGKPAIYFCCWNVNYCSKLCQRQHWISEHKRKCRRQ